MAGLRHQTFTGATADMGKMEITRIMGTTRGQVETEDTLLRVLQVTSWEKEEMEEMGDMLTVEETPDMEGMEATD